MEQNKKNIVITGAGKGLGFELVKKFASYKDYNIVAISRNIENVNNLIKNIDKNLSGRIFPISYDLEKETYKEELLPNIFKYLDKIDILINNAGVLINKPFIKQTESDFNKQFNVNVKVIFKLTQLLIPFFNKNAHIVNISSMGGFQGSAKFKGLSIYSASKGAVAILSECLAEELNDYDIKVNCLALGATQTEMLEKAFPGYTAPVSAKKMATYIAEFALNAHQFINGKVIPVSISAP
jgi:3-oxoacyl-[acyl-carrier protein] reductase